MRLDQYLVDKKLAKSRSYAQELISQKLVKVDGQIIDKPAFSIKEKNKIEIIEDFHDYVSRAALKLKAAVEAFSLDLSDKVVLDIGSATGGFTEYALRQGATRVIAVDVGSGQLADKLRNNPRVCLKENRDIRLIDKDEIEKPDFICCDVSFISLALVLPKISELADSSCDIICLFKPQFEVGRLALNKQGIVKDLTETRKALDKLNSQLPALQLALMGQIESPLSGKKGNQEYLLYLRKHQK